MVHGKIERSVAVNLVALRRLQGADPEETRHLRRYILALTILAATADIDLYLREGCNLRFAQEIDGWKAIPRRGPERGVDLVSEAAQTFVRRVAKEEAQHFSNRWPAKKTYKFDMAAAKKLLAGRTEEENEEA